MTVFIDTSSSNSNKVLAKCIKCGHVLISGSGSVFFGSGTTIKCIKCGNSLTLGNADPSIKINLMVSK